MSRQQEFICGLSHEVTIAVLPRLNMEELMFELNRRIGNLDQQDSIKDRLVSILRDVMLEEYRQLESGTKAEDGSSMQTIVMEQKCESATIQDNVPTANAEAVSTKTQAQPDAPEQSSGLGTPMNKENNDTSRGVPMHTNGVNMHTLSWQVLDTNNPTNTSYQPPSFCIKKSLEGDRSCKEPPPASDYSDVHIKMECHVSEDNQISEQSQQYRQMSQQSNLDHLEGYNDFRHAQSGLSHSDQRQKDGEEIPLATCQPTPDQDCENVGSVRPDNDSQNGSKSYVCDVCRFKTVDASDRSQHRQRYRVEKPFMCGECGYRASDKHRLAGHMRTHTGEKPFKCNQCNFKTSLKSALTRHMKSHSNTYSCKICDYHTQRQLDFSTHMKCHAGVNSHKCDICNYITTCKTTLTRHIKLHSDERPYSCQLCDYKGKEKRKLNRHMKRAHSSRPDNP